MAHTEAIGQVIETLIAKQFCGKLAVDYGRPM